MMKKFLIVMAGPAYLLLLAGFTCTHSDNGTEEGKAFFWKKSDSLETHYLYVDNSLKGVLPFLPETLTTAGNRIVEEQGLHLTLKPGSYVLTAKDKAGKVLCQGKLFLKRTESQKQVSTSWENNKCSVQMVYE